MVNLQSIAQALQVMRPKKPAFLRNGVQPVAIVNVLPKGAILPVSVSAAVSGATGSSGNSFTVPAAYIRGGLAKILYVGFGQYNDADGAFTVSACVVGSVASDYLGFVVPVTSAMSGGVAFSQGVYVSSSSATTVSLAYTVPAFTTAGSLTAIAGFIHPDYWDVV